VDANVGEPRVAYRETVLESARAEDRHVARIGDRSVSGHVIVEVRPQRSSVRPVVVWEAQDPAGAGLRRFENAIRESLLAAAETGPLAGYPMTYLEIAVLGGSVAEDAAEAAYSIAAARALQKAVAAARPWVVEPHMRLDVTVPDESLGDVLADLQRRRADITEVLPHGGTTVVRGIVPLSRMMGYATAVRSLTQGRASYTLEPVEYRPLPEDEFRRMFAA
jgi:elongation factor G